MAPPVSPFAVSVVPSKHRSCELALAAAADPPVPRATATEKTARMPSERVTALSTSMDFSPLPIVVEGLTRLSRKCQAVSGPSHGRKTRGRVSEAALDSGPGEAE